MSKIGFVIGNGSSRTNFDLRTLNGYGTTYGMNAIHRQFYPNHLICIQRNHLQEALSWDLQNRLYLYTTFELTQLVKDPKIQIIPKFPFELASHTDQLESNFRTGSWALIMAAEKHDVVVCIGMDYNNGGVYTDSDNYWQKTNIDYAPHMSQTFKIIDHYTDTQFIFVQDTDDKTKVFADRKNVVFNSFNEVNLLLT